jgi:hypothetical protein
VNNRAGRAIAIKATIDNGVHGISRCAQKLGRSQNKSAFSEAVIIAFIGRVW